MFIRKAHAGNAPGYAWEEDGQVIEVDDETAFELLGIPGGGFSIAEAPQPEIETVEAFDEEFEQGEPVEIPEEGESEQEANAGPKRSPGRPRLPRDDKGNIIRR